jgi:Domain of unknown function (DUF4411)
LTSPTIIYCIDTSSIIKWYVEDYPPSIFEKLQVRIEELIAAGRLRSPKAVFDEIKQGRLPRLVQGQTDLFLEESVPVQEIVTAIMAKHYNTGKPHKGINGADPFVIAMAKDGGTNWTVVADEHPGSAENRKIPFVCNAEGVNCITFQQMILAEGWKF